LPGRRRIPPAEEEVYDEEQIQAILEKIVSQLEMQTGIVALNGGMATVNIPENLRYLDADSTRLLLEDLWGNPEGSGTLGMLIPADVSPLDEASWGVIFTYEDSGHIMDDDAAGIDYDDLLKDMKASTAEVNKEREKLGYGSVELVGWAAEPRYDSAEKKLYWAKTLRFSDADEDILNYNIRVLGRTGVLNLNVVGSVSQLGQIETDAPSILASVDFNEGHRYADYDPSTDHMAEYGIAALIAGGVAAKTGLLKGLWVAILAFKKFIIIGVAAVGGWIAKLFSGRKAHAFDNQTPGD
jgi:uncharacterized membrane-anchored protein